MTRVPQSNGIPSNFWRAVVGAVPEPEHRFHPTRRWRIDYAWPDQKLAVEIEGGVWTAGRHTRSKGFLKDAEKYNALTEMGWRLLRYPPKGVDYDQIKRVIGNVQKA